MMKIVSVLACLMALNGFAVEPEGEPLIVDHGEWTDLKLMSGDRLVFQMASTPDRRNVVLSVVHLQDRDSEKYFRIDTHHPVKGATIYDIGGGPTIGYREGNFELANSLYLIVFDPGVDEIEIPTESFQNVPDYFRYVRPFPVSRYP